MSRVPHRLRPRVERTPTVVKVYRMVGNDAPLAPGTVGAGAHVSIRRRCHHLEDSGWSATDLFGRSLWSRAEPIIRRKIGHSSSRDAMPIRGARLVVLCGTEMRLKRRRPAPIRS